MTLGKRQTGLLPPYSRTNTVKVLLQLLISTIASQLALAFPRIRGGVVSHRFRIRNLAVIRWRSSTAQCALDIP
ncbi:hypothetical protein M405DRAFT_835553 [Rhizopogon salebrosus TDB-379]|nr:hypothetical protein M405DRAFT_835553 [Rhizopogon salebrosus TDB-379]